MQLSTIQWPAWLNPKRRKTLFVCAALFCYVAVNLLLVLHHEPWRDEGQAWLIARDLSPIGIINQMSSEGHPCLWHFVLMPFAKLGLPLKTMDFISLAVMTAAAAVLLIKAPFGKIAKTALLVSPLFMYFYPVISRSYCLIALFAVLLCAAWPRRFEKPLGFGLAVAGLVQTHVVMLGFATLVCLIWIIEALGARRDGSSRPGAKRWIAALAPPLLSAAFFGFQVLRSVNTSMVRPIPEGGALAAFWESIRFSLTNILRFPAAAAWIPVALVALLLVLVPAFKGSIGSALAALGGIAFQFIIYAFVYGASEQKLLSIGFILLWLCWVNAGRLRPARFAPRAVAGALCLLCLLCPLRYWEDLRADWLYPYSHSVDTAAYIRAHVPLNAAILVPGTASAGALVAQLPDYTFYHPASRSEKTFMTWDDESKRSISARDMLDWADAAFDGRPVYLLLDDLEFVTGIDNCADRFQFLFGSDGPALAEHEDFRLYLVL